MPTLTKRFALALYGGVWATVKDRLIDGLVLVGGIILFFVRLGQRGGFSWHRMTETGWDTIAITLLAICLLLIWHAICAAITLCREITAEAMFPPVDNSGRPLLVSPSGQPIRSSAMVSNAYIHPKMKIWGMAVCLCAVSSVAATAVWKQTQSIEIGFRVSPQLVLNGERVYGCGMWSVDETGAAVYPIGIEMFLQLQNRDSSTAVIDSLEFEIKDEGSDTWELLPQLTDGDAFFIGSYPKLAKVSMPLLKGAVYNRNLQYGDTIMGWVFLDYPKSAAIPVPDFAEYSRHSYHQDYVATPGDKFIIANGYSIWTRVFPFVPEFRAKIVTVDGSHYIVPFTLPDKESRWSEQQLSFTITQGYKDFSHLPVKLFKTEH
jgi:hypothetical protein